MTRNVTDLLVDCDPRDRVGEEVNRRNSGNSGKSLFTTIATISAILTTNQQRNNLGQKMQVEHFNIH